MNRKIGKILAVILTAALVMLMSFTVFAANETADAADATTSQGGGWQQYLTFGGTIVVFVLVFYFLIYRPQKKQERAANEMRNSLAVGDIITTNGGIIGRVVKIKDDYLTIESGSDKTKFQITKWALRSIDRKADAKVDEE